MAFDLSAAANILKVRYLPPIREQLNQSTILMSRIARDSTTVSVSGKTFTVPLHTSRNATAGSGRADGGTLPTAGTQGYEVTVIPNKYLYGRIQVTGPTIRAARDNAGAFVTAVESEIQGLTRDMKKSVNRQMHGDGRDCLAFWTGADDATAVTIDDGRGNAFVHLPVSGTLTCDVIDVTDNAAVLGNSIVCTLGAKASTNYSMSFTGTVSGSADGDYLVLEDTLGYQLMGLGGIFAAADPPLADLQGLDATTYPFWNAQVFSNSGTNRDLTLGLMQDPISAIATNSDFGEGDISFMLSNYGVRDKYVQLLVAEKRFVNTMKLDGGFTGVEFNGIPLVVDPQCKRNRLYYVIPEVLRIFQTSDYDWLDKDGSTLARVDDKDAYEATLFAYFNLGTTARNACALLDDITDS